MSKRHQRRPANRKAKSGEVPIGQVVRATERLWRRHHLTYDQAIEVGKRARWLLDLERPKRRRNVVDRLSHAEAERLIAHAYGADGQRGLLVKTLLLSGARVSEFVALKVGDLGVE